MNFRNEDRFFLSKVPIPPPPPPPPPLNRCTICGVEMSHFRMSQYCSKLCLFSPPPPAKKTVTFAETNMEIIIPRWINTTPLWQLHEKKYREMQTLCKQRGLKASGTQENLLKRLIDYDQKHLADKSIRRLE